jgi:CheY-like chemotaxis protein
VVAESVNIVVVEDDDGHATLIERNLKRAGLSNPIVRLRDGQEALDYFFGNGTQARFQAADADAVLLLDINMPRVDGIDVLRRLKADPRTAKVPTIMLTTTDDPREIERCYQLGCNVYVTKPVEYDAFMEAIRRLGFFLQIVKIASIRPAGAA